MRGTVGFVGMPTLRTFPAGVARVYKDNRHTSQTRLVLDKLAKLVESPVCVSCPLPAPKPEPSTNAHQVFEGNPASGALRFLHDALADAVIGIGLKTPLLARQLAQLSLGRTGAFALQVAAAVREFTAIIFNRRAIVGLTLTVGGDVNNTQVYAEELAHVACGRLFHFTSLEKVELTAPVDQIRLALHKGQQGKLMFSRDKRDGLPPADRPDAHGLRGQLPGQDALVVGNAAVWVKAPLTLEGFL